MKLIIRSFLFILFLILNSVSVTAQTEDGNKSYIPNITVTTPQAAALSKAGEIPIDISTGRINYTIPVFEIKEGSFTMPINLSYNYSGLLLDESPGYGGLGWNFNIGGSIQHTVNGLNDEGHEYDKGTIDAYVKRIPPYNNSSSVETFTLLKRIADGITDGEPDKYSVNVGDLNCSFYLDKDNNPVFLKNENYKVTGNSTVGFTLTDDKGIKYIFNIPLDASKITADNSVDYKSSFLLTEINFPGTTNKILFQYGAPASYNDFNLSQTLMKNTNSLGNVQSYTLGNNKTYTALTVRKLTKIITNNYSIELQYNNNPTEPALGVISSLKVIDNAANIVKNYDFTFSTWVGRRINLLNVKYNNEVINQMEYDLSLPYPVMSAEIDYVQKDLWGYYNPNARAANPVGLTNPYDNPSIKPNLATTKIGALKKITYQTKGYSLIDYEPNKVYMAAGGYNFPYDSDGAITNPSVIASTSASDGITVEKTFVITKVPAEVTISYRLGNETSMTQNYDQRDTKVLLVKDGDSDSNALFSAQQQWLKELTWIPQKTSFTSGTPSPKVTITVPGTYRIKAMSSAGSTAWISANYLQTEENFNQTVGGIRVQQVKNCDFNGQCITTTYNYTQDAKSTGIMLQKPEFYSGYLTKYGSCNGYGRMDYYNYTSIYPLSNFRGSPVLYKTVEKIDSDGSTLVNGKTVFTYYGSQVQNSLLDEESYFTTGLLDTKTVKDNANTTLTFQSNSYQGGEVRTTPRFVYAVQAKPLIDKSACFWTDILFNTINYKHESKNYALEKQEETNYYAGKELLQRTISTYNLDTGNLKGQSKTNSANETIETKNYYAQDPEMASQPMINDLIATNITGVPLLTQSYKAGTKISEQLTNYDQGTATSNLLVPQAIYAAKFPNTFPNLANIGKLERKISLDQYDDKGNIVQYTLENGAPVSFIWGYYKSQPIAKIENATYSQVSSYVANLQGLSNTGTETDLINALNALRSSLPNAMITTYTHIPLIGVSTITDPKGDQITYIYDSLGRLRFVKDAQGKLLSENQYHYKN
ncbi:hypothetical protein [Flavobacterium chilense]|uniref:YD repeat-containing protein n=1 Tax=Flavobacterium chilense TaxID=946677 RepID=A0A1M7IUY3_9FLAO|nr:hypothetical protein [Flavobacterium chilense]SHM44453.1 hypothetical protein SAMN05444484_10655 [Flavobacterium chilense]